MGVIELKDEEIIASIIKTCWHDNNDSVMPPLFHGTDASLISIPRAERKRLREACEIVIDSLCSILEDNSVSITDERLLNSKDNHGNSANAYVYAQARRNKSSLYSYDDFCVTNDPSRAIGYSKQAWIYGETGWVANRLIIGVGELGINLPYDDEFRNALNLINQRKIMEKNPVVLMVVNVNTSECYRENGTALGANPVELSFWMDVLKQKMSTQSLRIKNWCKIDEISGYVISESDYSKLVDAWNL